MGKHPKTATLENFFFRHLIGMMRKHDMANQKQRQRQRQNHLENTVQDRRPL